MLTFGSHVSKLQTPKTGGAVWNGFVTFATSHLIQPRATLAKVGNGIVVCPVEDGHTINSTGTGTTHLLTSTYFDGRVWSVGSFSKPTPITKTRLRVPRVAIMPDKMMCAVGLLRNDMKRYLRKSVRSVGHSSNPTLLQLVKQDFVLDFVPLNSTGGGHHKNGYGTSHRTINGCSLQSGNGLGWLSCNETTINAESVGLQRNAE